MHGWSCTACKWLPHRQSQQACCPPSLSQAFAALRGSPTAYSGKPDAAQTEAKLAGPAVALVALVQVGAGRGCWTRGIGGWVRVRQDELLAHRRLPEAV